MSEYLDDMHVAVGDWVMCCANISAPWFTPGEIYRLIKPGTLIDDHGNEAIHPSARFIELPAGIQRALFGYYEELI